MRKSLNMQLEHFFYQRAGYAKESQYAGTNWADGASHLGGFTRSTMQKI